MLIKEPSSKKYKLSCIQKLSVSMKPFLSEMASREEAIIYERILLVDAQKKSR